MTHLEALTLEDIKNSLAQVNFSFAIFTFHIKARQEILLPAYKGSAFRGGFGHVFKRVCCVMANVKYCNSCQLKSNCAYAYIFETPQINTSQAPFQSTNLPHPFIILPPLTPKDVINPGASLSFNLTLIGTGIDFLPYFIYTFHELGRVGIGRGRGSYLLERVTSESEDNGIYNHETETITGHFKTHQFSDLVDATLDWPDDKITLLFITPTRITVQNKLTDNLSFDLLIRNLLRRASLLAKLHCGHDWQLDYKSIIDFATSQVQVVNSELRWQDWERYSNRQQCRMKLGGFVGRVTYEGTITPFLPLIQLGHYIHIGKNTSFGMGKYLVENIIFSK